MEIIFQVFAVPNPDSGSALGCQMSLWKDSVVQHLRPGSDLEALVNSITSSGKDLLCDI